MQRLRTTSRSEEEEFELDRGNRAQLLALRFTGKKRSNSGATSATNMEQQHEAKSEADSVDSEVASVRTVPTSGYEGVLITNTHLCWRYLLNFTKIRQVHLLLTAIQQVMNELHCQDETATAPANDSESHPQRNDEAVEQETKQMSQSMACRSRRPRYAVVSCGDFNTTTNTLALAFMMRRSLPSPFPVDASHSIYYSYARAREASNEELNSLGVANNSSSSSSLSSASSSPSSLTEYASAFPLACAISLGAPPAPVPRFSRITKEEAIEAVRSLKRQELSCSSVSTTASPDGESAVDNDDASSVFYSPSMANAPPVETLHELICGFEAAIPFTSSSPSLEPTSSSPASSSSLSSIPTPSPASGLSASRFFRACARFAGTRASEFADDYLCFLPPSLRTELVKHSEAMWTNKAKSILSSAAAEMEEDEFKTLFAGVDVDANELWSAEAEFEAGMLEEAWQASKDMIEATERLVRMDVTSPAAALRIPRGAAKTVPASTSTATTSTSTSASTPAADANGTMSTATATATAAAEAIVAVADMTLNGEELDSGEEPKVAPVTPKPADPVELRKMNARLMLQRLMDLFALEMHAKSLNWVPEYTSVYGHYQEYVPEAVTTSVTAMSGAESSSSSSSVPSSSSSSSSSSSVPSSSTSSSSPSLYSNKEFRLKELHHMGPRFTTYCPEFSSVLDYILVPMTTTTTTTTTAAAAAKRSSSSKSCSEEDGIKMQLRPVSLLHLPDLQELMKYVVCECCVWLTCCVLCIWTPCSAAPSPF